MSSDKACKTTWTWTWTWTLYGIPGPDAAVRLALEEEGMMA